MTTDTLLRECREALAKWHSDFLHDYQKDADKCPRCQLLKRIDAHLAKPSPATTVSVPQTTMEGPPAGPFDVQAAYFELIMSVSNKYPNETRHQTALRYITQAERAIYGETAAKMQSAKQRGEGS